MPRVKLPNRRPNLTKEVFVTLDGDKKIKLLVTIGFDFNNQPMEVFCADFKAGTAMHTIIMNACIIMSRLLQHGNTPQEIYKALAQPPSVLGEIAKAMV